MAVIVIPTILLFLESPLMPGFLLLLSQRLDPIPDVWTEFVERLQGKVFPIEDVLSERNIRLRSRRQFIPAVSRTTSFNLSLCSSGHGQ